MAATCSRVRGQGCCVVRHGCPNTTSTASPRAGSGVGAAAGRTGAEHRDRHDRGAGDEREVGRTVVEAVAARRRRGCPRGRCRPLPRRGRPAGTCGSRPGRRGTGRAGSGRRPAGSAPSRPCEHLLLGQRVHGPRREDGQERAVDDPDVVGGQDHATRLRHRGRRGARATATGCGRAARPADAAGAAAGWRGARRRWPGAPRGSRSARRLRQRDDPVDDLGERQVRAVDVDRTLGHRQRRGGAPGVDAVALEEGLPGCWRRRCRPARPYDAAARASGSALR